MGAGEQALDALERGDAAPAAALGARLAAGGPCERAWAVALDAHRWLAVPDGGMAVGDALGVLSRALAQPDGCRAAARACAALARQRVLAFDGAGLAEVVTLHRRATEGAPGELRPGLAINEAWLCVLRGKHEDALAVLEGARGTGAEDKAPAVVIDVQALRALASLGTGDLDAARASARRAALMAQAEALPQSEYLAHVVLARLRRIAGRPHLATRILTALSRVAPSPWHAWLDWERAFAAAGPADSERAVTWPARAMAEALAAAEGGQRQAFEHARADLAHRLRGWRALAEEAEALAIACDPRTDAASQSQLNDWLRGGRASPPFGLHGAIAARGEQSETTVAYVVAGHGGAPRRFLRPGLGLVDDRGEAVRLVQTHRKQGRLDTAVATLALGGAAGLPEPAFFRAVYGFTYSAPLHKGALDVLLHRVRERVAAAAQLNRGDGVLILQPHQLLVVPDPRCAPAVDDRILALLAARGVATARAASEELGVPLRTVQTALAEMVAEGVLRSEGKGRGVEYKVEDTVFSEPTR